MMRSFFLFALLLIAVAARTQLVVSSAGAVLQNGSVSIEYSIGEIAIETLAAGQTKATQGLLQPTLISDCRFLQLLPTAFTPNGDLKNDCFGLANATAVAAFELRIYNRWGQLVFTSGSKGECWNGDFKGLAQPSGVYVYTLNMTTAACGAIAGKGTVLLIR